MKIIASFQTVEHFWRVYDHLIRPNEFKFTTDYHLFREVNFHASFNWQQQCYLGMIMSEQVDLFKFIYVL